MNAVILKGAAMRRPTPLTEHRKTALRAHTALAEMCGDRAGVAEWRDLADSCNMVEALVELGKYEAGKVMPLLESAKDGLVVAMKCAEGQMRMSGEHLLALRGVVTLHDQAIGKFSIGTMLEAQAIVVETVRRVLDGDEAGATVVQA